MDKLRYLLINPDYDSSSVRVRLLSDFRIMKAIWTIYDASGKNVASDEKLFYNGATEFAQMLEVFVPWTIEYPYLYKLFVTVFYEDGSQENAEDTFGIRKLGINKKNLLLNNKPFYMRGYIRGTVACEHENICGLEEEEFYARNIQIAKSYGYNTIRFHSRVPSKACFRAADRLGMFIHIEMRKDFSEYNNMEEMVIGIDGVISKEDVEKIIYSLINHPSLMVYCIGNEIKQPGKKPAVREISEYIKTLDSSRLFIDTCAHGEFDRDYVEFDVQHMGYYYPFGKNYNMFENTDNLLIYGSCNNIEMIVDTKSDDAAGEIRRAINPGRPVIAHEVCHYTALRDIYSLEKKFARYNKEKPWWIDEQKKMITAKGLEDRFYKMYDASKKFQFISWKLALEAIRRSPVLNGFHMLQFSDTDRYENSNGIVDCFDEKNNVDQDVFLKFNSDTVILADLPRRTFFEKESIVIPVIVSNFAQVDYGPCTFEYILKESIKETIILTGKMKNIDIDKKGIINICNIKLTLPLVDEAGKYELILNLYPQSTESVINNEWSIWIFRNRPDELDVGGCCFNLSKINALSRYKAISGSNPDTSSLYITDIINDRVFDALENGKDVMLIYRAAATRHVRDRNTVMDKYGFRATWERYKAVIWDRGTNYGGIINKDSVLKDFPNDGITDFQFYNLIEDSDKIILDDFPVNVMPVFEGIDKSVRDRFDVYALTFGLPDFQYDRTLRKFGYIFELKAGKGKLLVTGLNFTGLESQIPETCAMFEALIRYVKSKEFIPRASISIYRLKEYMMNNVAKGAVRERMMTQFWQLDDTPVESMQYWKDSEAYIREVE